MTLERPSKRTGALPPPEPTGTATADGADQEDLHVRESRAAAGFVAVAQALIGLASYPAEASARWLAVGFLAAAAALLFGPGRPSRLRDLFALGGLAAATATASIESAGGYSAVLVGSTCCAAALLIDERRGFAAWTLGLLIPWSLRAFVQGGAEPAAAWPMAAAGAAVAIAAHDVRRRGRDRERRRRAEFESLRRDKRERDARAAEERRRARRTSVDLEKRGEDEGFWEWDLETDRFSFSPGWKAMLGYAESEDLGSSPEDWFNLVHPHDLNRLYEELNRVFNGRVGKLESEHRMRGPSGSHDWVLVRGRLVRDGDEPSRLVGSQTNLRKLKAYEARLTHEATHDRLTGLPNRAHLIGRLREDAARAQRNPGFRFAAAFIDLDGFKGLNDSLGHLTGDQLLATLGNRLRAACRPGDTIARIGGDEFVALLRNVGDEAEAVAAAERLLAVIAKPTRLGVREVALGATAGVALGTTGWKQPEDLLRNADIAMYHAKAHGRGGVAVFDADMHLRAQRLWRLRNDLRGAVERDELRLLYQPIVSLATRRVAGVEALIRWRPAGGEVVSPAEFIPLAEEQGLIWDIGEWVLTEACRQSAAWRDEGGRAIVTSINLSARQLSNPEFTNTLKRVLRLAGVEPSRIRLELTETALMGSLDATPAGLYSLFCLGVGAAIDDFGTGYSSLGYLRRFQFNVLKIDKSFIADVATDPRAAVLVDSIIDMAHGLGLAVVAEGVETEEQCEALERSGCDQIQGYLAGRPVEADRISEILKADLELLPRPNRFDRAENPRVGEVQGVRFQSSLESLRLRGEEARAAVTARRGV